MRAGRQLWDPKGLPWIFYVIDISGFWIASTLFLFGSALLQLRSRSTQEKSVRRKEVILSCAILHLAFMLLFFGNQWSWVYYPYLLVIGAAVAADVGPIPRRIGWSSASSLFFLGQTLPFGRNNGGMTQALIALPRDFGHRLMSEQSG